MRTLFFCIALFMISCSEQGILTSKNAATGMMSAYYDTTNSIVKLPAIESTFLMKDSLLKEKLVVLKPGELLVMQNEEEYGYDKYSTLPIRVKVYKDGDYMEGYVPRKTAGLGYCRVENNFLIVGLSPDSVHNLNLKIQMLNEDGKVLDEITTRALGGGMEDSGQASYFHELRLNVENQKGIEKLKNVISVYEEYGACGYTNGESYIGWDGQKLYALGTAASVSDGGIFSYDEIMYFPSDENGKKNSLLKSFVFIEYNSESEAMEELKHDSMVVEYKINENLVLSVGDTVFRKNK